MHTAICAFDDRARAEQAVDGLVRAGFAGDDVHIEHKRSMLSSLDHFFARLLGREDASGHVDTYAQHVERGGYVVVVDSADAAQAERARTLLQEMQGRDLNLVQRPDQRPLRDIVARRDEPAGVVERSRDAYESLSTDASLERERALASHRLDATKGPALRDPDITHVRGPRYADPDEKPKG
jgi:hypothetical protein